MPTIVRSLRAIGVTTVCITDFDILNDENPLREIFIELGGQWQNLERDWKLVKTSVDGKRPELGVSEVRDQIQAVLNLPPESKISKSVVTEIQKILKRSSPWSHAKQVGKQFVPSGEPTQARDRLFRNCKELGLFIVEVGELESFVKSVGNHGPAWVNDVVAKALATDPELVDARNFISQIEQYTPS